MGGQGRITGTPLSHRNVTVEEVRDESLIREQKTANTSLSHQSSPPSTSVEDNLKTKKMKTPDGDADRRQPGKARLRAQLVRTPPKAKREGLEGMGNGGGRSLGNHSHDQTTPFSRPRMDKDTRSRGRRIRPSKGRVDRRRRGRGSARDRGKHGGGKGSSSTAGNILVVLLAALCFV